MHRKTPFFTSSPEFVIFCLLGNRHSDWGELQIQGRFILTLSNRVLLCSPDLTGVCYVQQAGLKLTALFLPVPSEYWNWRCHQTHVLSVVLTCISLMAHNAGHFSFLDVCICFKEFLFKSVAHFSRIQATALFAVKFLYYSSVGGWWADGPSPSVPCCATCWWSPGHCSKTLSEHRLALDRTVFCFYVFLFSLLPLLSVLESRADALAFGVFVVKSCPCLFAVVVSMKITLYKLPGCVDMLAFLTICGAVS